MEKELKFALKDEAAYRTLLGGLSPQVPHVQKNHYFDSVDRCLSGAARSALRIRGEGPLGGELEWEMTLKLGVSQEGAYFQAHEWNAHVPAGEAAVLLAGGEWPDSAWKLEPLQHFLEAFSRRSFVCLGGLENLRIRCPLFGDEVAEVDLTTFPDGSIDYEVEVETERPAEVEAHLRELAGRLGVDLQPQPKTKFKRFLERS